MKIFRNIAESLRSHSPSGRRKAKEPQGSGATEVPGTQHKAQPPSQSPPESSKSRPPGASLPSTSPEPKVAQNVNSISSNENVVVDTSKYSNVPNLRQLSVKEKNDKQAKNDMPGTSGSNKIHDEAVSPVLCDDGKALEDTDLWLKARNDLKADVREKFDKHFKNQDLFSIDQVSECIRGVKADCEKGSWGYVIKDGKKIVYRDIFDKVITWAVAFKDVGAAVAAFDPTQHAQLAWGAVGVIVTAAARNKETRGMVLDIEPMTWKVTRCAAIENLYLSDTDSRFECMEQLRDSLIRLYKTILIYQLHVISYLTENKVVHAWTSLLPTHPAKEALAAVDEAMKDVDRDEILAAETVTKDALCDLKKLLVRLDEPVQRSVTKIDYLKDTIDEDKRDKILAWISTTPFGDHHSEIKGIREEGADGTCQWLIRRSEFVAWRDSSFSSMFWLTGTVGAGKSTLVSLVIDTLLEKVGSDKGERVIYFYCDRTSRPEELDTPLVILTSLVKQLSYFGTMPIMDAIRETYDKKKNEGHLNEKECLQLIKDLTNQYPLTTIVIDALDEAPLETRTKLLARLSEVITSSSSLVKLFISSRWETDIEATFESSDAEDIRNILEIRPEDNAEDIENFVLHRVESDIRESRLFPGVFRANRDETSEAEERRLTLKHDIVRTLVERSKGMFRWAQLSLQVLHGLTSERAIRDRLGKLPPKLQGIYSIIFDGIMKGGGDGSRILPRILLWLMYGRSISMKSKDFLDVVSSDVGRSSENINKLELLDLCGNLVEWDRKQDTFRIAHLSVREFLEEGNDADFQIFRPFQGHVSLARTCLNHLGNCRSSHSPPFVGFSRFMCGYANLWWPWHIEQAILLEREETDQIVYKNCIGDFTALDVQRLQDNWDAISFSAMEAYVANDQRKGSLSEFVEMAEAGSIFGMLHLNTMVNTRIPKESSSWTTGFFKAVLEHDLASLRKLIYHPERNLNITDGGGMSALHIAVTTGQLDVAELLLVNDADPNVQTQINDYRGRVTHAEAAEGLIYAKCNHNRLHTWGALPTYGTNNDGRFTATVCGSFTPLHLAAMQGSLGFVELLIRKNADFNRYTRIQEFLGQGNSILLYNNSGRMKVDLMGSVTPLHLAVQYYHLDVARYLVQAGADINAFSLPFNGQLSIAKLINNNGRVKITHRTSISAIAYAIQHGDEDFVDFLLSRNAKLDNEFAIQLTTPNHSFTLHIGVLINNSGRLELESTHNGTGRLNIDLLITGKGRTTFSNRLPMPLYNLAKENDLGEKYFEVFGHPSKAANLPRGGKLQGSPSTNEKFEDPLENESSLKEKPKTEEENFKVLVKSGVIFTGGRLNINDSRFKG